MAGVAALNAEPSEGAAGATLFTGGAVVVVVEGGGRRGDVVVVVERMVVVVAARARGATVVGVVADTRRGDREAASGDHRDISAVERCALAEYDESCEGALHLFGTCEVGGVLRRCRPGGVEHGGLRDGADRGLRSGADDLVAEIR